jgi:hypothetical protein
MSDMVEDALTALQDSGCVMVRGPVLGLLLYWAVQPLRNVAIALLVCTCLGSHLRTCVLHLLADCTMMQSVLNSTACRGTASAACVGVPVLLNSWTSAVHECRPCQLTLLCTCPCLWCSWTNWIMCLCVGLLMSATTGRHWYTLALANTHCCAPVPALAPVSAPVPAAVPAPVPAPTPCCSWTHLYTLALTHEYTAVPLLLPLSLAAVGLTG